MTRNMRKMLAIMNDGRKRQCGRGRTMLALEDRGYVKRLLPVDARFACRFIITDKGRRVVE
ncbi:MAG: hypothetical protein GY938_13270 [Ketobacter sp.]|nr:hypothetical protein [Ketobacter sp.]